MAFHHEIHLKALDVARRYHYSVSELIDVLIELDQSKAYFEFECTSLISYCVTHLKLSEDVASSFITVARKSVEVPQLRKAVSSNKITLSKARRICSVINLENQDHWLDLAQALSSRKLEREVARVNPKAAVFEQVSYVNENRLKLTLGVSEELLAKLKRAQDLVSQKKGAAIDYEGTLDVVLEDYLNRHDPVRKAQRYAQRKAENSANGAAEKAPADNVKMSAENENENENEQSAQTTDQKQSVTCRVYSQHIGRRKKLSASLVHKIHLRDQGRCIHRDSHGKRCENMRWTDFHHQIPVSRGGTDTIENIQTLCSAHHRIHHAHEQRYDQ